MSDINHVVTAEQTQKAHQEKKTGQIIILFRLIKGVKNEDVPRAPRTLFLNEIER